MTINRYLDFKLCLIKDGIAWFSTQAPTIQNGEGWRAGRISDNAEVPYYPSSYDKDTPSRRIEWNEDGTPRFKVLAVPFSLGCNYAKDQLWFLLNDPLMSVEHVNKGKVPWLSLRSNQSDFVTIEVYAGTSLPDFVSVIETSGGIVYIPRKGLEHAVLPEAI